MKENDLLDLETKFKSVFKSVFTYKNILKMHHLPLNVDKKRFNIISSAAFTEIGILKRNILSSVQF